MVQQKIELKPDVVSRGSGNKIIRNSYRSDRKTYTGSTVK